MDKKNDGEEKLFSFEKGCKEGFKKRAFSASSPERPPGIKLPAVPRSLTPYSLIREPAPDG
jgi:hypothetical protein